MDAFDTALERAQADERLPRGTVVRDISNRGYDPGDVKFEILTPFLPLIHDPQPPYTRKHDYLRTPTEMSASDDAEWIAGVVARALDRHLEEWALLTEHVPGLRSIECSHLRLFVGRV